MQAIYHGVSKAIQKAVQLPLFVPLARYLTVHHAVTLRELKKEFVAFEPLEKQLEVLIDANLVMRENRRYTLAVAELKFDDEKKAEVANWKRVLSAATKATQAALLVDSLVQELESSSYLFLANQPLVSAQSFGNHTFQLVTLNGIQTAISLPNYFLAQQKGNVSADFSKLEHLIGDVHPEFFANQVGLVLEQAETGKIRKRNTIFFQSLVQTEVLNHEGQLVIEQVSMTTPSYQKNLAEAKELIPEFTDSLKKIKYCQELLTALIKQFDLEGITYLNGISKK